MVSNAGALPGAVPLAGPAGAPSGGRSASVSTLPGAGPSVVPLADAAALPPLEATRPPWPGVEMTSGGVTMHVRRTPCPDPDADPAVYVHGLSGSATNFTDLAAQLGPHAPGLALDLPGFGHTGPPASGLYTPAAHADAVLCFLAGLGRPVHLLGNSLGGTVALAVAARRPELVRSLTLLAPAMPDRRPDPRRVSDPKLLLTAVPWLRTRLGEEWSEITPRRRVEQMLRLCFGDPSVVAESRIEEAVLEAARRAETPWAGEALWKTTLGMLRGWFLGPRLWSVAARVGVPTLVVWGGRDRLVSPRLAERTARTLPRGRLLEMPEVGHVPQMERPVEVARAVLGMWQAVDAGAW